MTISEQHSGGNTLPGQSRASRGTDSPAGSVGTGRPACSAGTDPRAGRPIARGEPPVGAQIAGTTTPVRRPSVGLLLACAVTILAVLVALFGPALLPGSPLDQDLLHINKPPSAGHLLGTDHLGRDVLTRLVHGARQTLVISTLGAALAFLVGAGLVLPALALGRWTQTALFAAIDLVRALPATLLALLLIVGLGTGTGPLVLALGISFVPMVAHVTRAAYHREAARDYVRAARSFGAGRLHVLTHHILPNIAGTLITQIAIVLPRCIVTESVLSFLGVGSSPDAPTWGRMIADASHHVERAPHAIIAPLVALVLLTFSLSAIGNAVRRDLDPLRRRPVRPGHRPAPKTTPAVAAAS